MEGIALIAVARDASVEAHEPREGGSGRGRRRRPVEGRLHIAKRMASREAGTPIHVSHAIIHQADQLFDLW